MRKIIHDHPVVVLTGARQTGKSTLLQQELPFHNWHQVDLDDLDILQQAQEDPASLWAGRDRIVIDEVQRVPTLLPGVSLTI